MAELDRLHALVEINRAIANGLDYEEVLRRVVEQAAAFAEAVACVLLLVDGDGLATVRASVRVDGERVERFRAPVDERSSAELRELLGARGEDTTNEASVCGIG